MFCALVIENNKLLRAKLDATLKRHFPDIATKGASNGYAAMRQLHPPEPDLVLMSLDLPGESGICLIAVARSPWSCPVQPRREHPTFRNELGGG